MTLTNYLGNANAATANMGFDRQTAVILERGFFNKPYPQFTLAHEIILHAYTGLGDNAMFGNAFFSQSGLWRPDGSTATIYLTSWMSTDCTCTPEKPNQTPICQPNTAKW